MPPLHLADILSQGLPHYQQQHRLTRQQYQVCAHILACRTGQLGYQQWRCDQCGHEEQFSCSCRDRHCPRCQGQATQAWIAKQAMSLLPCPYFHLVFTLPHELNLIAHYAPNVLYHCLFKSLWQTLMTFAAHRHQGQLGMTCVLHTWGQNLSQHIHVHCLIPAGSLNRQSQWQPITKGYLYPVKALSTVFRGKMIAALKAQSIALPSLPATWCVYSKACVYPHQLLHYLARYTRKGALSESRLVNYNASRVRFRYKDYRDNNKTKFMTLSMDEFIRRYLQHVLPKGFMRIRHYGFLANACRNKRIPLIRAQCRDLTDKIAMDNVETKLHWVCSHCHQGQLIFVAIVLPLTQQIRGLDSS